MDTQLTQHDRDLLTKKIKNMEIREQCSFITNKLLSIKEDDLNI